MMTAAQAIARLESLPLRDDPRMAEALDVLRARVTPKPRQPKACPLAAAVVKVCTRPPSWSEVPGQSARYLDSFGAARQAQADRLAELAREPNPEREAQFSYAAPRKRMADDEARAYLVGIGALDNGRGTA